MEQQTVRKTYKVKLVPPLPKSGRWKKRAVVAATSTTPPWSSASPLGSDVVFRSRPLSRRLNSKPFAPRFQSMLLSTRTSSKMCWRGWTRPTGRSSGGCSGVEKAGFPRLKGGNCFHSFTFKGYGNGVSLDNGFLVLSTSEHIRVHWSRPLEGIPKTVTFCKEADEWYMAISSVDVPVHPLPSTGQETGIDMGLESFATLAHGRMVHSPRCYRQAEGYLCRCQRRVARRQKGSHRRRKPVILLAKAHQHVRIQRRDVHHHEAATLVKAYDVIYHEDLPVRNRVQNHCLAKSISDAGGAAFLAILTMQAVGAGKRVQAVNPAFTSQRCSGCGVLVQKGLSVRWHSCPGCETSLHRDHVAARNILRLGQEHRSRLA
jgi:putative transposase